MLQGIVWLIAIAAVILMFVVGIGCFTVTAISDPSILWLGVAIGVAYVIGNYLDKLHQLKGGR